MDKRNSLKTFGLTTIGVLTSRFMYAALPDKTLEIEGFINPENGKFELPQLGYSFDALEPNIDRQTMEIHYSKHHQGYVNNLNKAIEGKSQASWSLEKILANANNSDTAIRNNAGGHYNHSLFWNWIRPGGQSSPSGAIAKAIDNNFGSFDKFKEKFEAAAKERFGSGWAWLVKGANGKLYVYSTPNQDNPLMTKMGYKGRPLLGIDVWEHAYYLKYQNKRADYISAFWNIVNWDKVNEMYG